MAALSNEAISALRNAGWYEGRQVDLSDYQSAVRSLGYMFFPTVETFLERYRGLTIHLYPGSPVEQTIDINPNLPTREEDYDLFLETLRRRAGEAMLPIGWDNARRSELFMDAAGKVYGEGDGYLYLIGMSDEDAIEALMTDRPPLEEYNGDYNTLPTALAERWDLYYRRSNGGVLARQWIENARREDARLEAGSDT